MRKYSLQVHLDAPMVAWIRAEAERREVSLGEVVREAIGARMDAAAKAGRAKKRSEAAGE